MNRRLLLFALTIALVFSAITIRPVRSAEDDRKSTVIFDIDGGKVLNVDSWNPFIPQRRMDHGFHQAVIEPMFILNYETGKYDPWVAESMTSNATLDEWTLKLKKGV